MLRSEAIEKYWAPIIEAMRTAYADTVGGNTQEKIYIWEDGEIETLYGVYGDNSFLRPKQWEDRELFYITTVSTADPADFIDVYTEHMTDEEYNAVYEEAAHFLVDGYDPEEDLQNILEDAIRAEKIEAEEAEELRFYQ